MSDRPSGAVWKQSEHHATWLVGCSLNRHRLSLTVGYPAYQQPKRKLMLVWSRTDVIWPITSIRLPYNLVGLLEYRVVSAPSLCIHHVGDNNQR